MPPSSSNRPSLRAWLVLLGLLWALLLSAAAVVAGAMAMMASSPHPPVVAAFAAALVVGFLQAPTLPGLERAAERLARWAFRRGA